MYKRYIVAGMILCGLLGGAQAMAAPQYYGASLCAYPEFNCVKVQRGDSWRKLFPNTREREIVKRLNRTNIPLSYRSWIVVPVNLKDISLMSLSPFPQKTESVGEKLLVVDLSLQAFGAYNAEGYLVHWGPISGGRDWCSDVGGPCRTAKGSFRFFRKQGRECESSRFPVETNGGAPMPYCMHYFRGFALHGSTLPGYHASHGCVRLFFDDAEWLNKSFVTAGSKGTRVVVQE